MVSYNAVISAAKRTRGRLERSTSARRCCAEFWRPTRTAASLNNACEKFQDICRAVDVCAVTLRQALQPNMASYRAFINASENGQSCVGPSTAARRCFANLLQPNMVSYNACSGLGGRARSYDGHSMFARKR